MPHHAFANAINIRRGYVVSVQILKGPDVFKVVSLHNFVGFQSCLRHLLKHWFLKDRVSFSPRTANLWVFQNSRRYQEAFGVGFSQTDLNFWVLLVHLLKAVVYNRLQIIELLIDLVGCSRLVDLLLDHLNVNDNDFFPFFKVSHLKRFFFAFSAGSQFVLLRAE